MRHRDGFLFRSGMKIVIIGGGFGGVYTARNLAKMGKSYDVLLINRNNYFLFTPLLHEVATGGLSEESVAEPIREVFRKTNVNFLQAEVTNIDREKKIIHTDIKDVEYDYLVIATGATTNFFNTPCDDQCFTLKDLNDAVRLRDHIITVTEKASSEIDMEKRKELLTFTVVGGGPTGVELSAELAEFVFDTICADYTKCTVVPEEITIQLIHAGGVLLGQFSEKVQKYAHKVLTKKGVTVRLNTRVQGVEKGIVTISDEEKIASGTVIWTAGVMAQMPDFKEMPELNEHKRIEADEFLRVRGRENEFVLGDVAGDRKESPMLAQVAANHAKIVAKNVCASIRGKKLTPYTYKKKGILVSLGQWNAAGDIGPFTIKGKLTWLLWRTVYFFKFNSWRKRSRIAFEWTINLFYPRDITNV